MDITYLNHTAVAIALVRISLGILFLFQAYDKIFKVGLNQFFNTITASGSFKSKGSLRFIRMSITLSSYIELIGGILLIVGLFSEFTHIILAINLIMVVLSFSYLKPLWDMQHVLPRLAMLVFLILMSEHTDVFSIDAMLRAMQISF